MRIQGRRVLVTGGTRGIGREICLALREAGAKVLACGSRLAEHDDIRAVRCDVCEPADVQALAEAVDTYLGGLDILVHCAGIQQELDLVAGVDMADVEREVAVNLLAPMRVTNELMPKLMASDGAAIVNVTSILAMAPKQRAPVYCATKAGLASWTESLRYQLEARGVRVMELVPPLVATGMTKGRQDGAIPPEQVARACVDGLRNERPCVRIGKARLAQRLHRWAPSLLARKMRYA